MLRSVLLRGGGKAAYQAGILSFLVLMFIGFFILRTVPEPPAEPGEVVAPPEHLMPAADMPGPDRP